VRESISVEVWAPRSRAPWYYKASDARVSVALAPASLVLKGDAAQVTVATAWLKEIVTRAEFADNERVLGVLRALGIVANPKVPRS